MSYQVPQLLIQQEFESNPVFVNNALPALIIGPFCPPPGYIESIPVVTAGYGYTTPPTVTITDSLGVGTGATAYTTISAVDGSVTAIKLLTGGSGYTAADVVVTIAPPPNTATFYATLSSTGALETITMINGGGNYIVATPPTLAPASILSAPSAGTSLSGMTLTATVTASSPGSLTGPITAIAISGSGYTATWTTPPTVTIPPPKTTAYNATPTQEVVALAGTVSVENTNTLTTRTIQWVPAPYTSVASYTTPTIGSVTSISQVASLFGDIASCNPIAYALVQALNNSNGVPVYYSVTPPVSATMSEELAYDQVLTQAAKSNNYYGIVPLTFNPSVQADITGHVNSMSSPQTALWRVAWFCNPQAYTLTGTVYTLTPPAGTNTEVINYLASLQSSGTAGVSSSNPNSGLRRIHNVFPQSYTDTNNATVPGYFLCAALAGLRAGSVPHQSLTNTQVIGPSAVPIVTNIYSVPSLNQIAGSGVWIVTQSNNGGSCYTRHQLTADNTGYSYREDSITANVDSISYGLQEALSPFIGVYNITPSIILQIRAVIDQELAYYLTNTYTPRAGNQLIAYNIVSIAQDTANPEMLNVTVNLTVPYPLNYITINLVV